MSCVATWARVLSENVQTDSTVLTNILLLSSEVATSPIDTLCRVESSSISAHSDVVNTPVLLSISVSNVPLVISASVICSVDALGYLFTSDGYYLVDSEGMIMSVK